MVAGSNPARGASHGFYILRHDRLNIGRRGIIRLPAPRRLARVSFMPTNFPVPEPSTWAMMILGFAGVGFLAYRRKRGGNALTAA